MCCLLLRLRQLRVVAARGGHIGWAFHVVSVVVSAAVHVDRDAATVAAEVGQLTRGCQAKVLIEAAIRIVGWRVVGVDVVVELVDLVGFVDLVGLIFAACFAVAVHVANHLRYRDCVDVRRRCRLFGGFRQFDAHFVGVCAVIGAARWI